MRGEHRADDDSETPSARAQDRSRKSVGRGEGAVASPTFPSKALSKEASTGSIPHLASRCTFGCIDAGKGLRHGKHRQSLGRNEHQGNAADRLARDFEWLARELRSLDPSPDRQPRPVERAGAEDSGLS
jgi:hypothetical protein